MSAVEISRDLYYTPEGQTRVRVPEDALFVLGDNSPSSKDSRLWLGRRVTLEDGEERLCDAEARVESSGASLREWSSPGSTFVDQFGEKYELSEGPLRHGTREPRPFVPRNLLLGKAFFVFWPPARKEAASWKLNWKFVR